MYDIIIIGAGPAGATLARLLSPNYKVLILEKRNLLQAGNLNSIEKCCGGLIAPDAQAILASMGLGIPKEVLVSPQLFSVRVLDIPNGLDKFYQRFYINTNREAFDRYLVSLIPKQFDFSDNSVCYAITPGKIPQVSYQQKGKQIQASAKLIVVADGANSPLRKIIAPNNPIPDTYVCLQETYSNPGMQYFSAIFDSAITDFYSWTIPKDDKLLIGSAFPYKPKQTHYKDKLAQLVQKLNQNGYNLGKPQSTEAAYLWRPRKNNQIFLGSHNILLIGEAAGLISPSSAEGFSYAFESASLLANAIAKNFGHPLSYYQNNCAKLQRNLLMKNIKSPLMYNSFLRKIILKSGIKSLKMKKIC